MHLHCSSSMHAPSASTGAQQEPAKQAKSCVISMNIHKIERSGRMCDICHTVLVPSNCHQATILFGCLSKGPLLTIPFTKLRTGCQTGTCCGCDEFVAQSVVTMGSTTAAGGVII
mmetsp:Transcript_39027/g.71056  ORF Transcript_39027/g.71056 Transcript_39027/m.71056 type:complete len:115 (-) Transcript_39027:1247-1591(-)